MENPNENSNQNPNENSKIVTMADVLRARKRIWRYVYETPLEFSRSLSANDNHVYLKLECQQLLKSYKIRGAFNRLLTLADAQRRAGVICCSSGNYGAGVSYAAGLLDIGRAHVYIPKNTPGSKTEKIRYYGAQVTLAGDNYDEAHAIALEAARGSDLTYIDSSSDVPVIAGQGTVGLEIMEQNPDIDTILVPIGCGGVITGISAAAKALNPNVRVYGVQTAACPAMVASLRDNICYRTYPSAESVCESLIGGVEEIPFLMARQCIDDIIVVQESTILEAVKLLLTKEMTVAEPGGAVAAAAIMENPELFENKNIALVITGGNIDEKCLEAII